MSIIYSTDFISFTPVARSEDSDYPAVNVTDRWSLMRLYKSEDATANAALLTIDMGAAKTVAAIVINHCNFTSVVIEGNDTDSWASPSFTTTATTISRDPVVGRYKVFIPLTAFNYRYLRIFIPTGQTPTDDTVWYVGGVEVLDSYQTLVYGPSTLQRTAEIPSIDVTVSKRVTDVIEMGEALGWSGSLSFGVRQKTAETEMWTLSNVRPGTLMVLYENGSDTSIVYVVRKKSFYKGTLKPGPLSSGNTLDFEEVGV